MRPSLLETTASAAEARKSLLGQSALFSTFTGEELEALAEASELVTADEGEILFREGEPGNDLYIVVSGNVRSASVSGAGLEQHIALHGPRSSFGEMALLDGRPRSATATVSRRAEILKIGRDTLDRLASRYPATREKFLAEAIRLVCSRLRASNQGYWRLAGRSLRARADAAQSRSRLVSLVSHEFRTPLTVIKNSAQRLRLGTAPDPALFHRIEDQCGRLEILVDDLITLALLQVSDPNRELTDVDLEQLSSEVAAEMSRTARARGVRLSVAATAGEPIVDADRSLVRRALRHLVDNALRYSPTDGEVIVSAEPAGPDRWMLSVRDQGSGIERAELDRLMSSFVQQQDPLNRDIEGLGIGLALAEEVARAHGGRLVADSRPGAGSCFALELPSKPGNTTEPLEFSKEQGERK